MKQIPGFMMRHEVTVRPLLGVNATGEVYGDPVTVKCMFGEKNQMVRSPNGEEVTSKSFYITTPDHEPALDSKVTTPGRVAKVVAWDRPTWPGMQVPANTKVYLD